MRAGGIDREFHGRSEDVVYYFAAEGDGVLGGEHLFYNVGGLGMR